MLILFLYIVYIIYSTKFKKETLYFIVDINEKQDLTIHLSNCKKINNIENSLVQDSFDTHEEAWEYSNLLEYDGENCIHCISQ